MTRWTAWLAGGLAVVLLLAAAGYGVYRAGLFGLGTKPAATMKEPDPPPVVAKTPGRSLFPTAAQVASYSLDDGTSSTEALLADGDRLVQTYNGAVYITWFFTPEGVLRADPKGKGQPLLLRYLPAELEDGLVWKQPVADNYAWFRLNRMPACAVLDRQPAECWQVQLLNRGELVTFTFASGMGAVGAVAENFPTPRESFRKTLTGFRSMGDDPATAKALAAGLTLDRTAKAPLEPATAAEFDAAVAAYKR